VVVDQTDGVPTSSPPVFPDWQSAAREKALRQGRLFVAPFVNLPPEVLPDFRRLRKLPLTEVRGFQ
jgi:hypothetical protein